MAESLEQRVGQDNRALSVSIAGLCFPVVIVIQGMLHAYGMESYLLWMFAMDIVLGLIPGSILGVIALIMNRKQKRKLVKVLGVLPIILLFTGILLWFAIEHFLPFRA